ncbi:MAG: OmpA family protein [Bacteroidota bacterium]
MHQLSSRLCSLILFLGLGPLLGAQENDSIQIIWSAEVYFDFAQSELKADGDSLLQEAIKISKTKDLSGILITAHTDDVGSNQSNLKLAKARGETVKKQLLAANIPDSLLQMTPFGEEKPIVDNSTESNRQLNRRVTIDLLEIVLLPPPSPMTTISGQVTDKESGEGIQADIIIHGKALRDSFQTDEQGYFSRSVPENVVIGVDVYAKGHFYDTQMLKTKMGKQPKLTFALTKAVAGASVDIKNLYFVGNQAILLQRSLKERPKVLKFMQLNEEVKIEIAGHVNHPGVRPEFLPRKSYYLSINRAKNIYDYLLSNGIPASRMTFKGYGNSQMRFPRPTTLKQQELNRRVEIKILGSDEVISAEDPVKVGH